MNFVKALTLGQARFPIDVRVSINMQQMSWFCNKLGFSIYEETTMLQKSQVFDGPKAE